MASDDSLNLSYDSDWNPDDSVDSAYVKHFQELKGEI